MDRYVTKQELWFMHVVSIWVVTLKFSFVYLKIFIINVGIKKEKKSLLENDSVQKTNPYSNSKEFSAETWPLTLNESPEQEFPFGAGLGLHLLGGYFQF